MLHSQPEQASGPSGASPFDHGNGSSTWTNGPPEPEPGSESHVPGNPAGQPTPPDQPTLHEFLTRLVSNPQARSTFESDPRASLDGAGLGDLTATDVLQGASLVLDYAPVEVVQEYGRSVQNSVEMFAASTQHVAINHLHHAPEHLHQEATEPNMLNNDSSKPDYSAEGDTDAEMSQHQGQETNVNISHEHSVEHTDSHNLISMHHIGNGNDVLSGNAVGVVGNTVNQASSMVGDTVNNTVNNTVNDITETSLNVVGAAPGAVVNMAGDMTTDLTAGNTGGAVNEVTTFAGDATAAAGAVTTSAGVTDSSESVGSVVPNALSGVTGGAEGGVVGGVAGGAVGGVAGGAVDTVAGVTGGVPAVGNVTSDLGLGEQSTTLEASSDSSAGVAGGALDAPVDTVSGVAGGAVSGVAGGALDAPVETATGLTGGVTEGVAGGAVGGVVETATGLTGGVTEGVAGGAVGGVVETATGVTGGATGDLPLDLL